jgi:cell division septation protein DedD
VAVAAPVSVPAPMEPAPVTKTAAKPAAPAAAAPLPAAPLPAAAPLPVAREAAPAVLGSGYYINVGLFAIASNGTRAQKKLQDAQLPVLLDTVSSDKGMLTRVRVGPFASKAKANAAAKTIRGLKLEARVFKK